MEPLIRYQGLQPSDGGYLVFATERALLTRHYLAKKSRTVAPLPPGVKNYQLSHAFHANNSL